MIHADGSPDHIERRSDVFLIDYARNEVGLKMGGVHFHRHYGWTTDREKAEAMRDAGAVITAVPSHDQRPEARKFDGYEVSFAIGSEKWEGVAA